MAYSTLVFVLPVLAAGLQQQAVTASAEKWTPLSIPSIPWLKKAVEGVFGSAKHGEQGVEEVEVEYDRDDFFNSGTWLQQMSAVNHPADLLLSHARDAKKLPEESGLDEEGYLLMVKLGDNKAMKTFVERLLVTLGLAVRDQGALDGMIPHFSGEKAHQTFFALKQELIGIAADPNTWLIESSQASVSPKIFQSSEKKVTVDISTKTKKDKKEEKMENKQEKKENKEEKKEKKEKKKSGKALLQIFAHESRQKKVNGKSAPLCQDGYHALVKLKSDYQMEVFITRVVKSMQMQISDKGRLNGVASFYSGTKGKQSFAQLRKEIIGAVRGPNAWVSSGRDAVLSEIGYQNVAALKDDMQMALFVRRMALHHGCAVVDEDAMTGVVPYYSGTKSVQSLAQLSEELREACGLVGEGGYFGSIHDVVGEEGVLQIRLPGTERYQYSKSELESAGIVPTQFAATNAKAFTSEELSDACPMQGHKDTKQVCADKEKETGANFNLGKTPGCKSKIEQAITDSHKRALEAALEREESDWTAIIEDDVVPLHPGYFDASFKEAWAQIPKETKMVRLSWCSFESDLGSIKKKTFRDAGFFRLIKDMSWDDEKGGSHYYTGGCTTGYLIHKSFVQEVLDIFPCCCPIDCCLERQLFYTPAKHQHFGGTADVMFRGQEVMVNLDAWDSREDSFNYTTFNQGGVFVQDNRDISSLRPEWNKKEKADDDDE